MRDRLIGAAVLAALGLAAQVAYRSASPGAADDRSTVLSARASEFVTAVGNAARDIALVPDTTRIRGLIPQRTTLDTLLRGHGVADDAAVGVVQAAAHVFDPRRAVLARAHP
jgi:hypothetical protein